jgi:polyribonucleotide nucleotidyltransferase
VLETDEKGRIKLSLKALLDKPEGYVEEERPRRDYGDRDRGGRDRDRGPRRERSDRGDRGSDRGPGGEREARAEGEATAAPQPVPHDEPQS